VVARNSSAGERRVTAAELERARQYLRSIEDDVLDRLWALLGLGFPRYAGRWTWLARAEVAREMRRRQEAET
jgi:hypothetical protein